MRVAILGYGIEGEAALRYFREKNADITVFDQSAQVEARLPEGVAFKGGKNCFADAYGFDVLVRGPAVRPDAIETEGKVTDVTGIFFENCPAPIIGVTGTKGKGTTSSLIFEMLKAAGVRAHLAGNIGVPAIDILPDVRAGDVVVLELSSFQLWELKRSPRIAVVLLIEGDHMDVHSSMEEYILAKANIARWQNADDLVVYHPTNADSRRIAEYSHGTKLPYARQPAAHVEDGEFMIDEHKICSTSHLLIPGEHNIENACAAITAAWQFTQDTRAMAHALGHFKGLEHRLKLVREVRGVKFYDDSIATTPGSAIAALKAFERPKLLILGGSPKGADYTGLAAEIAAANIRSIFVIGQEAPKIEAALRAAGVKSYENLGKQLNMAELVKKAAATARSGDVVILSPAAASFGMFKNYKDRGEQFIAAVDKLSD